MSPRKLTPLRAVVRGLSVADAQAQLQFMPGKGPHIVSSVLKSATANATHNHGLLASTLVVRDLIINAGLTMKRAIPVSRGMSHPILKRMANVTVVVGPKDVTAISTKKQQVEIETITADEHLERESVGLSEELKPQEKIDTGLDVRVPNKQELASSKIRTAQQGGNKTHRRKSMSEK